MGRVVRHGVVYEDAEYEGFCVTDKEFELFWGQVRLAPSGRITATGPCPDCGTQITKVLA